MQWVPAQYGKREMHPVVLLTKTPIEKLAGISPLAPMKPLKGVEFARFGKQLIIVNHRSSPIDISGIKAKKKLPIVPSVGGWLAAHSSVLVRF
jgi:hypothetical protein